MHPTKHLTRRVCTGIAALTLSLGGALGALVVVASPASADTTVTNTNDDGATDYLESLDAESTQLTAEDDLAEPGDPR